MDYVEKWLCPETTGLSFGRNCSNDTFPEEEFSIKSSYQQRHCRSTSYSPTNRLMVDTVAIQRFLTTLSDVSVIDEQSMYQLENVPIRCHFVTEVQDLYEKLQTSQTINPGAYRLNVIVAVLKEILRSIPNGLFGIMADELCKISLESSLQITIMYLHSIISELSASVRLFSYCLCKALKNLSNLTNGHYVDIYTEMLLHFTPVLFPNTLGDVQNFLRGARLLLVMVDYHDRVFCSAPSCVDENYDCMLSKVASNEQADEELFFKNIINSLQDLEATLACEDSGVESEPEEVSSLCSSPAINSPLSKWSSGYDENSSTLSLDLSINNNNNNNNNSTALSTAFYHFAYVELDDQLTPTEF